MNVRTEGWCPTHRKWEPCHDGGRLNCPIAWNDLRKEERQVLAERDRLNPEPVLRDIRDDIRAIRVLREEAVTTEPRPAPPRPPPKPSRIDGPPRDVPPRPPERRGVAL